MRDGVRVAVRVAPGARREAVIGFDGAPAAGRCRVAVTAPPVEGRANAALIAFLAKQWDVPKSSLSVVLGAGARDKIVHVAGDAAALVRRLEEWREQQSG